MTGHLEFYEKHGISPVRYAEEGHAERMDSLFRQLRVLPSCLYGASVLEVASGSGQTGQYLASLYPHLLVMVEPNGAGIGDILKLRIQADVVQSKLEAFNPERDYQFVICQNWLGCSEHERGLLRKVAGFVAPGGVLLTTVISETGLQANALRRQMAERLLIEGAPFGEQVDLLVRAFGPHLETMPDMTRSHEDWIKDNMLNPAWAGIGLTLPMLINELCGEFDILGTSPDFIEDWRWFKSLHGEKKTYNAHALKELERKDKWFVDARVFDRGDLSASYHALREAHQLLDRESFAVEDVAGMNEFNSLFGRETIHVSLTRKQC